MKPENQRKFLGVILKILSYFENKRTRKKFLAGATSTTLKLNFDKQMQIGVLDH